MNIGETLSNAYNYVTTGVSDFGTGVYSYLAPGLEGLATRVDSAWTTVRPCLVAFGLFLQSPPGISICLLLGSIALIKLAEWTQGHQAVKILLVVQAVVLAAFSGMIFFNAGYLPAPFASIVQYACQPAA